MNKTRHALGPDTEAQAPRRRRDPEGSRRAILEAARVEFCRHGLTGARVGRISTRSRTNARMIYHYFGSKEDLYLAVLEKAYAEIRNQEQELNLAAAAPGEGMRRLIAFTFDFFASRGDFIALIANENMLQARYLKRLTNIRAATVPLVVAIQDLLERGQREGIFRAGVDPVQLYVSIVAQSQLHISNRHTLSVLFDRNLADTAWLDARRSHAIEILIAYLTSRDAAA